MANRKTKKFNSRKYRKKHVKNTRKSKEASYSTHKEIQK